MAIAKAWPPMAMSEEWPWMHCIGLIESMEESRECTCLAVNEAAGIPFMHPGPDVVPNNEPYI